MIQDENYRDKPIEKFTEKFEKLSEGYSATERWNTACIVAKKIVYKNLALRKKSVGELLKIIRKFSSHLLPCVNVCLLV